MPRELEEYVSSRAGHEASPFSLEPLARLLSAALRSPEALVDQDVGGTRLPKRPPGGFAVREHVAERIPVVEIAGGKHAARPVEEAAPMDRGMQHVHGFVVR